MKGNAIAQNNLGHMYFHGNGVPQDYKLAMKWLHEAAKQGNPHAQNEIGYMAVMGLGVQQNPETAFAWFRLAAKQGLPLAQANLGIMYVDGSGVARDRLVAGCVKGAESATETFCGALTTLGGTRLTNYTCLEGQPKGCLASPEPGQWCCNEEIGRAHV